MNFPLHIISGIFIILLFLILIQVVIIIYMAIKSEILKTVIIIISSISSIALIIFTTLIFTFAYEPEHIVEKENKTMVAYVNSFLQVNVNYYDYVNSLVRGNKLKIDESYGRGGYDPFDMDKIPLPKKYTYYDDNGEVLKSNW